MNSAKSCLTASFILSLLVCAASPAHAAKYKITWLLGHPNLDFFEASAQSFKTAVEKGSHGDIEVNVVPAENPWENTKGKVKPEIAEKVAKGEAQMGHSFTNIMSKMDPRLEVFDLPYLFTGYLHLEGVFEGPLGKELLEGMRSEKIVGLAFTYSGGAQGVATTDRVIRGPEDLKGLKVGVFGTDVDKAWLTGLGATAVPIEHQLTTINPLTKEGAIDASVVTWRRVQEAHLQQAYKNVNMMNASYLVSVTYINEAFLNSLPAEYQTLIKTSAQTAARIERARTIELNEENKREMAAKGIRTVFLTEKGRASFDKALAPIYEKTLNGIVGKDLIEKVRKTPASAVHPSGLELVGK